MFEGVEGGCIPSPLAALVFDLGGPDDPIAGEFETVDMVAYSTTGTMRRNGLPRTVTRVEAPARARATAFEGF